MRKVTAKGQVLILLVGLVWLLAPAACVDVKGWGLGLRTEVFPFKDLFLSGEVFLSWPIEISLQESPLEVLLEVGVEVPSVSAASLNFKLALAQIPLGELVVTPYTGLGLHASWTEGVSGLDFGPQGLLGAEFALFAGFAFFEEFQIRTAQGLRVLIGARVDLPF